MDSDNKYCIKSSRHNRIESLGVIMTITQAIALSGCNKTESDITIIHLTKGLQIGVLGGDNFKTVDSHAPRLVRAIADGLNVKRRVIKQMALSGELTADIVVKAIESQFNIIDSEFKELPMSLGGDKPNKKTPIEAGILAGLCTGAVIMVFFLSNCRPVNAGVDTLQGNDISLQGNGISLPGNDFLPPCYVNEINAKLLLALFKDKGYDGVLSQTNSGRANRSNLAFYVTDSNMDSQIHTNQSDTASSVQLSTPRAKTLIKAIHLPNDYDGMTSLNKIAERRISGAAAICAESEPRHPIPIPYSVTPTQKQIGGIHA